MPHVHVHVTAAFDLERKKSLCCLIAKEHVTSPGLQNLSSELD